MTFEEKLLRTSREDYGDKYQDHLLEMYKLYVQSADNISSRRQSANSFFLSINTAIIGAVGYLNSEAGSYGWAVGLAGILLCVAWFRSVRAYKGLNSGKFKVIHALEAKLPVSLYDAEWEAVGRGEDPRLYLPFTRIEVWVPKIFILLHLAMILLAVPWKALASIFCT